MRIPTLSTSLLSLALCVSAALQPIPAPAVPAPVGRQLARRQVSIGSPSPVPTQCTSTCNPVNDEVSLGCPVTACCTTTFETEYYNCLECVGMVLDASNYSTLQNGLDLLYTTCVDMGFVLPRMELPGQTDNSSSSSTTGATPTSSSGFTNATGAAASGRWYGVRVEALIGAAALLGLTTLW